MDVFAMRSEDGGGGREGVGWGKRMLFDLWKLGDWGMEPNVTICDAWKNSLFTNWSWYCCYKLKYIIKGDWVKWILTFDQHIQENGIGWHRLREKIIHFDSYFDQARIQSYLLHALHGYITFSHNQYRTLGYSNWLTWCNHGGTQLPPVLTDRYRCKRIYTWHRFNNLFLFF